MGVCERCLLGITEEVPASVRQAVYDEPPALGRPNEPVTDPLRLQKLFVVHDFNLLMASCAFVSL